MTTFKELRGTAIESVSSDPSNPELGQIWYNNTIGVLKSYKLVSAAWSSGGALPVPRAEIGGAGTQTAALAFGGFNSPPFTTYGNAYKYDGSTWTATGSMVNGRMQMASFGTQTAAVGAGGYAQPVGRTEKFDGSTWTSSGNMNNNRRLLAGVGTQTAGIATGGFSGSPTAFAESYNGTSWTNLTNMPTGGNTGQRGAGTQTAALIIGGGSTPKATLNWNGSTWTSLSNLPVGTQGGGSGGNQTAAISFGGSSDTPTPTVTQLYDGTSWTTSPATLSTGRLQFASASSGPSAQGLGAGGYTPGGAFVSNTESFTGAYLATQKITTS
jgi:hypothetical protein